MKYAAPNTNGSIVQFKAQYDNYIGGQWVAPVDGAYFDDICPITGKAFAKVARSQAADVEKALDAAHAAKAAWGKTSAGRAQRHFAAHCRAHRTESGAHRRGRNLGKRQTRARNPGRRHPAGHRPFPLFRRRHPRAGRRHFRNRRQHRGLPLPRAFGVVGQIIPWNFPLLMATWKLAPALAAGNCVVLKPAEQTPVSILYLLEIIGDLLPPGVVNVVNGFGVECGKPLAQNPRIAKVAFTGETGTGRLIMNYASENIIPVTLELGGKSPSIFFADVMDADDDFFDKCLEGFAMFALNQGEVCTCPSRVLIQESIYERFIEKAIARVKAIKVGDPLDTDTMVGAQASQEQFDKINGYLKLGREEGAEVLAGGAVRQEGGDLAGGFYIQPTIFKGHNQMRIFQEEIFGPVVAVTTFKTAEEALAIANDTVFGLGAAVWSRDMNTCYRMGRGIQAGRVWTNCYHLYPAHAAFGGYKKSGIGRENHKMMLAHYQQTKCLLVSYSPNKLGFF